MQGIFSKNIKSILLKNNIKKITNSKRFYIGRNNQVWLISTNKNKYIIKIYPFLKKNLKSRLFKEVNFLNILEKNKLNSVPKH